MSEDLKSRLANWKFKDAEKLARSERDFLYPQDHMLIEALSNMLGNSGYFDGDLATIVGAAIDHCLWKRLNLKIKRYLTPKTMIKQVNNMSTC